MTQKQYANKRDANEREIIDELESFGASVIQLDAFDMVCGYNGVTHIFEIKNPEQAWKLTPKQTKLIDKWVGSPFHIITNAEQAINILKRFS